MSSTGHVIKWTGAAVGLDPDVDPVRQREHRRSKTGYGEDWAPAQLVEELRLRTPRLGLWL
jgi:hypothetical protein